MDIKKRNVSEKSSAGPRPGIRGWGKACSHQKVDVFTAAPLAERKREWKMTLFVNQRVANQISLSFHCSLYILYIRTSPLFPQAFEDTDTLVTDIWMHTLYYGNPLNVDRDKGSVRPKCKFCHQLLTLVPNLFDFVSARNTKVESECLTSCFPYNESNSLVHLKFEFTYPHIVPTP